MRVTLALHGLIQEGMLVLYKDHLLPFFLLQLSSSAFTADESTALTYPVIFINSGIPV